MKISLYLGALFQASLGFVIHVPYMDDHLVCCVKPRTGLKVSNLEEREKYMNRRALKKE